MQLRALDAVAEALEGAGEGELLERLRARQAQLQTRQTQLFHRSLRLLRAHPSAAAKNFQEALESLRKLEK